VDLAGLKKAGIAIGGAYGENPEKSFKTIKKHVAVQ